MKENYLLEDLNEAMARYEVTTIQESLLRAMRNLRRCAFRDRKVPSALALVNHGGPRWFIENDEKCYVISLGLFAGLRFGVEASDSFGSNIDAFYKLHRTASDLEDNKEFLEEQGVDIYLYADQGLPILKVFFPLEKFK